MDAEGRLFFPEHPREDVSVPDTSALAHVALRLRNTGPVFAWREDCAGWEHLLQGGGVGEEPAAAEEEHRTEDDREKTAHARAIPWSLVVSVFPSTPCFVVYSSSRPVHGWYAVPSTPDLNFSVTAHDAGGISRAR